MNQTINPAEPNQNTQQPANDQPNLDGLYVMSCTIRRTVTVILWFLTALLVCNVAFAVFCLFCRYSRWLSLNATPSFGQVVGELWLPFAALIVVFLYGAFLHSQYARRQRGEYQVGRRVIAMLCSVPFIVAFLMMFLIYAEGYWRFIIDSDRRPSTVIALLSSAGMVWAIGTACLIADNVADQFITKFSTELAGATEDSMIMPNADLDSDSEN